MMNSKVVENILDYQRSIAICNYSLKLKCYRDCIDEVQVQFRRISLNHQRWQDWEAKEWRVGHLQQDSAQTSWDSETQRYSSGIGLFNYWGGSRQSEIWFGWRLHIEDHEHSIIGQESQCDVEHHAIPRYTQWLHHGKTSIEVFKLYRKWSNGQVPFHQSGITASSIRSSVWLFILVTFWMVTLQQLVSKLNLCWDSLIWNPLITNRRYSIKLFSNNGCWAWTFTITQMFHWSYSKMKLHSWELYLRILPTK